MRGKQVKMAWSSTSSVRNWDAMWLSRASFDRHHYCRRHTSHRIESSIEFVWVRSSCSTWLEMDVLESIGEHRMLDVHLYERSLLGHVPCWTDIRLWREDLSIAGDCHSKYFLRTNWMHGKWFAKSFCLNRHSHQRWIQCWIFSEVFESHPMVFETRPKHTIQRHPWEFSNGWHYCWERITARTETSPLQS